MIRIVLVDDHPLISEGIRRLLDSFDQFEVVADFKDGASLLDAYDQLHPDAIILDVQLPDLDGIQITKRVRSRDKKVRILILSMHDEYIFRAEAELAGANGFLSKAENLSQIPMLLEEMLDNPRRFIKTRNPPEPGNQGVHLSPQELSVLKLVAEGNTTVVIGQSLGISPLTVKTHRKNLFRKLDASNSADLIRIAYQRGIL